jgi:hypothetical protein
MQRFKSTRHAQRFLSAHSRTPRECGLNRGRYSGDLAPRAESPVTSRAILNCGKAMTAKLKMIMDAQWKHHFEMRLRDHA